MVESAAMVRAMRPGVIARRAILRELRRRKGSPASAAELATAADLSERTTRHHLGTLESTGLIEATPGWPTRYSLTAAGRIATD